MDRREGSDDLTALRRALAEYYLPNQISAHLDPTTSDGGADLPLLQGKTTVGERAALYVCHRFTCQAPVTEPDEIANVLDTESQSGGRRHTLRV